MKQDKALNYWYLQIAAQPRNSSKKNHKRTPRRRGTRDSRTTTDRPAQESQRRMGGDIPGEVGRVGGGELRKRTPQKAMKR
jgi:hypothetical protein